MSQIVVGDFAAQVTLKAHEVSSERYGEKMPESVIPRIFEVLPASEMNQGLYHRETMTVRDGAPVERQMGEAIEAGSIREELYALCRRRFFARSYDIPAEMLKYARLNQGNAFGSIEAWAASQAREFAEDRFEAEQLHAAKIFNKGGLTAGHDVFDNSVRGAANDSGGDLAYDGKPLFNLTGNARTAVSGGTYYNGIATAFSDGALETLENLVADTNGWRENSKSGEGGRLNTMPNVLVGGQSMRAEFARTIEARAKSGTANNDANAFLNYAPIIWPYIDDSDAWYVGKARAGLRWFQDDEPPELEFQYDAKRRTECLFIQSCMGAYVRPSGWRYWGGSQFATS